MAGADAGAGSLGPEERQRVTQESKLLALAKQERKRRRLLWILGNLLLIPSLFAIPYWVWRARRADVKIEGAIEEFAKKTTEDVVEDELRDIMRRIDKNAKDNEVLREALGREGIYLPPPDDLPVTPAPSPEPPPSPTTAPPAPTQSVDLEPIRTELMDLRTRIAAVESRLLQSAGQRGLNAATGRIDALEQRAADDDRRHAEILARLGEFERQVQELSRRLERETDRNEGQARQIRSLESWQRTTQGRPPSRFPAARPTPTPR